MILGIYKLHKATSRAMQILSQ